MPSNPHFQNITIKLPENNKDIDENKPQLNQANLSHLPHLINDFSYSYGNNAQNSPGERSSHSSNKKNRFQLKRNESNTSLISDIVKKKRITFLKSASLFTDEQEIFGGQD